MYIRTSFSRFTLITNIIACFTFVCFIMYNVLTRFGSIVKGDMLGFIVLGLFFIIYLLSDIEGLNLLKKLKNNKGLTRRRVIWIVIVLLLQFVLQLFLAYGIYIEIKKMLTPGGRLIFYYTDNTTLFVDTVLLIAFLTATYNIFAILGLIKKVWNNQLEFNQLIQEIGSNK